MSQQIYSLEIYNSDCTLFLGFIPFVELGFNREKNDIGVLEIKYDFHSFPHDIGCDYVVKIKRFYADGIQRVIDNICWYVQTYSIDYVDCTYVVTLTATDGIGLLATRGNPYPLSDVIQFPSHMSLTGKEIMTALVWFNFGAGASSVNAGAVDVPAGSSDPWEDQQNGVYAVQMQDAYCGDLDRRDGSMLVPTTTSGINKTIYQFQADWAESVLSLLQDVVELQSIDGYNIWFDVLCDDQGGAIFKIWEETRGRDFRNSKIASPEMGSFEGNLTKDWTEYADIVIAVGDGDGFTRETSVAFDKNGGSYNTKFGPREKVINASQPDDSLTPIASGVGIKSFLDNAACLELSRSHQVYSIDGDLQNIEPFRLFDDINLGDIMTIRYLNQEFVIEITGYSVDYDSSGESVSTEYGILEINQI